MITVEVNPDFHGPTIVELAPVLDVLCPTDDIKVRWGGMKEEIRLLQKYESRKFVVCVASLNEMSIVSGLFGTPLMMTEAMVNQGRDSLANRKMYNWRKFTEEAGPSIARSLIVKIATDAVRQGLRPRLASVAADVLLGKANPSDADVLMRLRTAASRR